MRLAHIREPIRTATGQITDVVKRSACPLRRYCSNDLLNVEPTLLERMRCTLLRQDTSDYSSSKNTAAVQKAKNFRQLAFYIGEQWVGAGHSMMHM